MAGFVALLEGVFVGFFRNRKVEIGISATIIALHSLLLFVDAFLLSNFGFFYHQEIGELLVEANSMQAKEFVTAYCSFANILILSAFVCFVNFFAWLLNVHCKGATLRGARILSLCVGLFLCATSIYGKVVYNSGFSVPEFSTPIRFAHSVSVIQKRVHETKLLRQVCTHIEATADLSSAPAVVVVIGESFSKFHCSLYGYEKTTYPLLQQRVDMRELILMNDVVAVGDLTHVNMKAIFSLGDGGDDFTQLPLFPMCFKQAGFTTLMFDTQYLLGQGKNFLSDLELSQQMFDYRNLEEYEFDGEMIDGIALHDVPSLYVIHLWGQHFDYQNRYPQTFSSFDESDYPQEKHARVVSEYDNACLYNDFVINRIIEKFIKEDAIIVYFSDHGEEVYEFGDKGHASALTSEDIRYQLSVPMMVWMSNDFVNNRPTMAARIQESADLPIMTSEICHFLLEVAGIETPFFNPAKSFVNSKYNKEKSRIVLKSLDFDQKVSEYAK